MSCPHVPNGQLSCLLHIYILSRIQWTWFGMIQSGSVCSMMFTKSKTQKKKTQQLCTRGQVKMYPMGNKGVCCTSTCWDKNNELHLEWFRAIVFNLHCLQSQKYKKNSNFVPVGKQNVPIGQLGCLLHIYMLRQIQWAEYGVIQSGSFCSTLFTKSKTPKKQQFRARGKVKMSPMGK